MKPLGYILLHNRRKGPRVSSTQRTCTSLRHLMTPTWLLLIKVQQYSGSSRHLYDGENMITAKIVPQHSSAKRKDDTFPQPAGTHENRRHMRTQQTLHAPHLHEGELLSHALMHAGAEPQVGKRLLVLLPPRPEAVGVELECPRGRKQNNEGVPQRATLKCNRFTASRCWRTVSHPRKIILRSI